MTLGFSPCVNQNAKVERRVGVTGGRTRCTGGGGTGGSARNGRDRDVPFPSCNSIRDEKRFLKIVHNGSKTPSSFYQNAKNAAWEVSSQ